MSILHSFLATSYLPLRFMNSSLSKIGFKTNDRLRVILFHDIPIEEFSKFTIQLEWLMKTWNFVSPGNFEEMLSSKNPVKGKNLLLTFDDGFSSNRLVAETILDPLGIKAIFFVISEFIEIKSINKRHQFINKNLKLCTNIGDNSSLKSMTIDDLKFLINSGHTIGAHTYSHVRLSEVGSENLLKYQIILSTDKLEKKLGIKVKHFAYPFGDLSSFSPAALALARKQFPFIYTGLRGNNTEKVPQWAIRRDAVQSKDRLHLVGALLEGGADLLYIKHLDEYEGWGRGSHL